jgi:hypothetical protein
LQGHRLSGGAYAPIERDPAGFLESQELGLRLRVEGEHLRFYRLDTGEQLLTPAERAAAEAERAAAEAERADREAEARQAAEAELARLRAELSRRPPA